MQTQQCNSRNNKGFLICHLLIIFLLFTTKGSSQVLQQSNSIKTYTGEIEKNSFSIDPPKIIDTISLKIDTTDIFRKGLLAKSTVSEQKIDEFSRRLLNFKIEAESTRQSIQELQNLKNISEEAKKDLEEYKNKEKLLNQKIDSITLAAQDLKKNLDVKTSEAESQLVMKQQYRKEYYEKLLEEFRTNINIIDSNSATYERELNAKLDSLNPKRWPLYNSNKDSMVREMAMLYSQLLISTVNTRNRLTNLKSDHPDIKQKVKTFGEIDVILREGAQPDAYIDKIFSDRKKTVAEAFSNEKKHNDDFRNIYNEYRNDFQVKLSRINEISAKYKPEGLKQSSDASLLANFTQPLNQSTSIIPGIDIFAYRKFNSKDLSIYGQAKLFFKIYGVTDLNNYHRFYVHLHLHDNVCSIPN